MDLLVDALVLVGIVVGVALGVLYVYAADRMVSGR
jgi:multisubunit Na+/H+ antiporter MnhC subunit